MPSTPDSGEPRDKRRADAMREPSRDPQALHPQDSLDAASISAESGEGDIAAPEFPPHENLARAPQTSRRSGAPTALQAAAVISGALLLAKFIGLAQRIVVSSLMPLDANDAYTSAFRILDFVNYLVAGGAMSLTFIPIFTELRARDADNSRENSREAWRFFSTVASVMSLVLLALILATHFAAPFLVARFFAPFDSDKRELTVAMLRIMLPAQWAFYVGGMIVGVLNANKRFGASALTGAMYNLVALLSALVLWAATQGEPLSFAWGILVGALAGNFLLPLFASTRGPREERLQFRFSLNIHQPSVKKFFRNVIPIMLGVSFPVVDQIILGPFASHLPGAIAQLENANRVMSAPLSILAQAAAVAAFPFLASDSAAGQWQKLSDFLRGGLRRLLFIAIPVSFALVLIAKPLIVLLFRHGEFSQASAQATAIAFAFYSIGLFAWAGQQFVARGFYALQDTVTPTVIGTAITFAFYIPLLFVLVRFGGGVAGFALATSLGAGVHFAAMLIALEKKLKQRKYDAPLRSERVLGTMLRTLCACVVMSAAGLLANELGARLLAGSQASLLVARIFLTSAVAMLAFHFAAVAFRIPEWEWLRGKVFGRFSRPARQ